MSACSIPQVQYYFKCNEQTPEIVAEYIPKALFGMGYNADSYDSLTNTFVASKIIKKENLTRGIQTDKVQMTIKFNFDTAQSVLTQQFVTELAGKVSVKNLNSEQVKIYGKDAETFQEKMIFYCNPKFEGR